MTTSTPITFPKERVESIQTNQYSLNEDESPVSKGSMSLEDSLPGEVLKLKTFGTIFPHHFPKLVAEGAFFVTNHKVINY